jgi:hypothetical protein
MEVSMDNTWQDFLKYLEEPNDTEYGDFKRRTDAHLRRMIETGPPLSQEQAREISKLRDEILWEDHANYEIDYLKKHLREKISEISQVH